MTVENRITAGVTPDGWIELFHEFDTNKNEELCKEEVMTLMRVCGTNPTDKEVEEYIRDADKNGDKKIDCEEFCSFMEKQCAQGEPKDILREAFDWYDKDKNGYIERKELKGILKDCGEDPNDETLIDELIESADLNGDGKIDLNEFVYRMQCT
ncbi:uncharacterized protein LOC128548059 [Mercenaria mercenaria]|uniref:uncharacterized protein LOC128548059 n=1 Tax=Mercenaria mercenaria TaxID=6596 RepID=UPI00234EBF1C|nr:uncharacterized protein LOC128548059 [Mercenaria mercenaria]